MRRSNAQQYLIAPALDVSAEQDIALRIDEAQDRLEVNVLLVEPNDQLREALAVQLAAEGYLVICAATAHRAFELLAGQSFDLFIGKEETPPRSHELILEFKRRWPHLPFILLIEPAHLHLAQQALHNGADDLFILSQPLEELGEVVERNLTQEALARRRTKRYRTMLQASGEAVLDAMLTALALRDVETEEHSLRVTAYTIELAERMAVPKTEMYHIERGALLHDIGKIGIPDQILLKPTKLTSEERLRMQTHSIIGYNMCARIESLRGAARIVLHHHEAWDGNGYPHGLRGEAIPLGSRIFAIADALDAMTSNRPYRSACSLASALEEIERCSGSQFDPDIVKIALSVPLARWEQLRHIAST
jgi:putative nucleotidyltransferase with HDIG domain